MQFLVESSSGSEGVDEPRVMPRFYSVVRLTF